MKRVRPCFFDLQPHPFQERILEKLTLERTSRHCFKNLVIAATGTGKTVIAAFDYQRFRRDNRSQARLLFIAHRQEILEQALFTFRQVLRDSNFGEMLAGSHEAVRMEHLFCSIQMMTSRQLWHQVGSSFYNYIVVDEAHHGTAASYRPLFDHFEPKILLGLTATPERMDGGNVAADFHHRFAAEIRLPEALEEKLLCPFHYFGVADPVDISKDHFWRNGRYDDRALDKVYTGDDILAKMRVDTIVRALDRYEPARETIRGVGFCVTMRHARFMADAFNRHGIASAAYVSDVDRDRCDSLLAKLRSGCPFGRVAWAKKNFGANWRQLPILNLTRCSTLPFRSEQCIPGFLQPGIIFGLVKSIGFVYWVSLPIFVPGRTILRWFLYSSRASTDLDF